MKAGWKVEQRGIRFFLKQELLNRTWWWWSSVSHHPLLPSNCQTMDKKEIVSKKVWVERECWWFFDLRTRDQNTRSNTRLLLLSSGHWQFVQKRQTKKCFKGILSFNDSSNYVQVDADQANVSCFSFNSLCVIQFIIVFRSSIQPSWPRNVFFNHNHLCVISSSFRLEQPDVRISHK